MLNVYNVHFVRYLTYKHIKLLHLLPAQLHRTPLLHTDYWIDYRVNTPLYVIGGEVLARRAVANQRIVFLSRRCTDSKLTDNANIN